MNELSKGELGVFVQRIRRLLCGPLLVSHQFTLSNFDPVWPVSLITSCRSQATSSESYSQTGSEFEKVSDGR